MLSPKHHEFDQISKAKVPFSWELKPGVSRKNYKTGDKQQWKLPPPPSLRSTQTSSNNLNGDQYQGRFFLKEGIDNIRAGTDRYNEEEALQSYKGCPFTPNKVKTPKSSFRKKEDDPFLEAYRKCLEQSPLRVFPLARNDKDYDYVKKKKKSLVLWLWSKYSSKVGLDGWLTGSRFGKRKPNKRINSVE